MEESVDLTPCLEEAQRLISEVCVAEKQIYRAKRRIRQKYKKAGIRTRRAKQPIQSPATSTNEKEAIGEEGGLSAQEIKEVLEEGARSIAFFASFFLPHHCKREFSSFHHELMDILYSLSGGPVKNQPSPPRTTEKEQTASLLGTTEKTVEEETQREEELPTEKLGMVQGAYALPISSHTQNETQEKVNTNLSSIEGGKKEEGQGGEDTGQTQDKGGMAPDASVQREYTNGDFLPPSNVQKDEKPIFLDSRNVFKRGRVVIAAPRGHAKSTIVSLVYVLWCICYRMEEFIVVVSDAEDQSMLHLNAIKAELEGNERIRLIFGDLVGKSTWGELVLETANGIRVQSRGTGQRVRGLKFRTARPGLVICDDILSDDLIATEERRVKLKRWFMAALEPAVAVGGKMIVIGTILHQDDLLSELLESERWVSRVYDAEEGEDGNVLWPAMYSREDLEEKREEYEARGEISLYYREYRNKIVSNEEAEFRRESFKYVSIAEYTEMASKEPMRYFLTIDPAYKTGKRMDYSVFLVTAMDLKRMLYVVEISRGRYSQPQFFDRWFALYARYRPQKTGMQVQDWSRFFKPLTEDEMRKRGVHFPVTELATYSAVKAGLASKKSRISRMSKYYASGSVTHVRECPNIKQLESELLAHPYSRFDDIADCLGMLPDLVFPPERKKERVAPEWYEDVQRNPVSGY